MIEPKYAMPVGDIPLDPDSIAALEESANPDAPRSRPTRRYYLRFRPDVFVEVSRQDFRGVMGSAGIDGIAEGPEGSSWAANPGPSVTGFSVSSELAERRRDAVLPSEAVLGFAAWLTTRDGVLAIGAGYHAAPIAELVEQYRKSQGWTQARDDFHTRLKSGPNGRVVASIPDLSGRGNTLEPEMVPAGVLEQEEARFRTLAELHAAACRDAVKWRKRAEDLEKRDLIAASAPLAPAITEWMPTDTDLVREYARLGGSIGAKLIAHERTRQVQKGYTAGHDEDHGNGELAIAAGCLAVRDLRDPYDNALFDTPGSWPFKRPMPTYTDRVRELTVAGALIAAEIDRILRLDPIDRAKENRR